MLAVRFALRIVACAFVSIAPSLAWADPGLPVPPAGSPPTPAPPANDVKVGDATTAHEPLPVGPAPDAASIEARPGGRGAERVYVHLESNAPVILEHRDGSDFVPVCAAPCDRWLPVEGEHRIGGPATRASGSFTLRGPSFRARVSQATPGGFAAGITLSAVGLVFVVVSDVASFVWVQRDNLFLSTDEANGWLVTAVVAGLAGAGLIAGGVPLLVRNARTHVDIAPGAPPAVGSAMAPREFESARPPGIPVAATGHAAFVLPLLRLTY